MSPVKRCCRSCPRCDDCPALALQATLRARRDQGALSLLFCDVLRGDLLARELPEPVAQELAALDRARRREPVAI
jgi:hypothetical protein